MTATIENLDYGPSPQGLETFLKPAIEGYNRNCTKAMFKAAASLAQAEDILTLLKSATDLDEFHETLIAFSEIPRTMLLGHEGLAWQLNTAIKDNLLSCDQEFTKAWLDCYAITRPGEPKIVRKAVDDRTVEWEDVNDLRIAMEGATREMFPSS